MLDSKKTKLVVRTVQQTLCMATMNLKKSVQAIFPLYSNVFKTV